MAKYKKQPDGRYRTRIFIGFQQDGKRKYKSIYGRTINEVETKLREFQNQKENGLIVDSKSMTVEQWGVEWLRVYKAGVRPSTREMYELAVNNYICPSIGKFKLRDVRNHNLQGILTSMANPEEGYHYSKRTVEIARLTMRQMFDTAYANGLISSNPALKLSASGAQAQPRRALTQKEQDKLLSICSTHPNGMLPMLIYYSGMRRGEALALTRRDIDFGNGEFIVNKAIDFQDNDPQISPVKRDASVRNIPIPDPFLPTLRAYVEKLPGMLLFYGQEGNLMTLSSFRRHWEPIREACGIDDLTPHVLRHTYATRLYDMGVDVKVAQRLLGHKSVMVTMQIYTHISVERAAKSSEAIRNWGTLGGSELAQNEKKDS